MTCRNRARTGPLPMAAGRFTIPTAYGNFIAAAEDARPENVPFDGGLLRVGVY